MKLRTDRVSFVGSVYYGYKKGEIDLKEQLKLLVSHPCEMAAALFLLAVDELRFYKML